MSEYFKTFIKNIENDFFFSYSRFQDGELIAVIQYDWWHHIDLKKDKISKNCDNHIYFTPLSNDLYQILTNNIYISYTKDKYIFRVAHKWFINTLSNNPKNKIAIDRLKQLDTNMSINITETFDWFNIIYQNSNLFINFIDILNKKNIILVGPAYLKSFHSLNVQKFVEIPFNNCYLKKNKIILQLNNILNEYDQNNQNAIILFCASMLTNCIIDSLFERTIDKHTMLDIGSSFDVFFINNKDIIKRSVFREAYKPELIQNLYPQYIVPK